jgi:superoxide dismutase, Cu-Zn family
MRKQFIAWIIAAIIVGSLLSYVAAQHTGHSVELKNAKGESVGTATLSEVGKGVRIKLNLKNLPAG